MDNKNAYYLDYLKKTRMPPQSWYHRAKINIVGSALNKLPPGSSILDAGCGCGNITGPFTERYEVYGVDSEQDSIDFCKGSCAGIYARASLYSLPFENNYFDSIVCLDVIEHLETPGKCIAEFHRVLKPGGSGIICTVNYSNILWLLLENTWYRIFGGNCKPYDRNVHPARFTPETLSADVARLFKIDEFILKNLGMEMFVVFSKRS